MPKASAIPAIFPVGKSKHAILKRVYFEGPLRISDLIRKTEISQASAYRYVRELVGSGIMEERIEGEKPLLRILAPKFSNAGNEAFALLEIEKRMGFDAKHRNLAPALAHFEREISPICTTALIHGSFARDGETKESDLDIIVVDPKRREAVEAAKERCFVTVGNEVSVRLVESGDFMKAVKSGDGLFVSAAKEHVIIANPRAWVEIAGKLF